MSPELRQALEQVAWRLRRLRLWGSLALCWLGWAAAGALLALGLARLQPAPRVAGWLPAAALAALALASAAAVAAGALRSGRDRLRLARRIEARHPELRTALLAAVEEDARARGRLGYLQAAVVREALEHNRDHDWADTVSPWALRGARVAHLLALLLFVFVVGNMVVQARALGPGRPIAGAAAAAAVGLRVEPGDVEIERGTSLLVVARFDPDSVPPEAGLVVDGPGISEPRRPMTRSLEDPAFAGRVESVDADLAYRVEFGAMSSETYHIKVFEYPEVLRIDAQLQFPAYTDLEPKTVEDIRHVTAVEGTGLTLTCRLNKAVASARFVDEAGASIPLAAVAADDHAYRASLTLDEPRKLRVELLDAEGRAAKRPTTIAIHVTKNRPATVKMTRPAHDVRVSPVEELTLQAKLDDDFGLVRRGLSYTVAGQAPIEIVLDGPDAPAKREESDYLLDFESLGVAPDNLVTYSFWAEDIGPDGHPRRSSGDLFFAEVRPFEEIFRQGEQPSAGSQQQGQQGQGNGQQAMQLAELQKEIINGTWRLIRRETGSTLTDPFAEDAQVVLDAQRSALEQAEALGERIEDAESRASLDRALAAMKDAEARLAEAIDAPAAGPLTPALAAEQAAYQALLKLRDREFNVVRGNQRQQGGGSSAGSPSQRQLQQLELSNEENRYEEQRTAQAGTPQNEEQREDRQILNRLRELARRQGDLNERLKELQSALEAAEDPAAREEIERQLKRLRDQQEQILRDTDELRERMEEEQNRERLADAREQVEQGREHVRQASEALEEGRLSQALTEGTRAGRQLEELRDEMRREASGRFDQALNEMRDRARQLDETQKALTEQLEAQDQQPQHALRDGDESGSPQERLEAQQESLDALLERMRATVQDAEETEPLLAETLFDAEREAQRRQIPDALDAARRLAELGINDEAGRASRAAGEGIEELRKGVEEAAESILGDESAALRLARDELHDLGDQIDREIARATGREPGAEGQEGEPVEGEDQASRGQDASEGETPPREPGQGGEPGERPEDGQPGRRDGRGEAQEPQDQPGRGGRPQDDQPGEGEGEGQGRGEQQDGQPQGGEGQQPGQGREQSGDPSQPRDGQPQGGGGGLRGGQDQPRPVGVAGGGGGRGPDRAGLDRLLEGLSAGPGGPVTGEGFREWSDRMRDVEELLDDPELRAEAARIRERVRGAREEFKRHSKEPDWNALQDLVAEPIRELQARVGEELRRRESPDSLVPIDRDPVPPRFAEGVRRYYERLGSGQ